MAGVAIVVFSDLVDSTALLARLGDDRMEAVRRTYVGEVGDVVTASHGRLVKTLGDGVMASFDSALGALRAAAGIQSAVEHLDEALGGGGLTGRVGVAAGEPIRDGNDLHGMPVVIAARLCAVANGGEVLAHELVRALVASRDVVAFEEAQNYELKGVPGVVRASSLRWRELAQVGGAGVDRDEGDRAAALGESSGRVALPRMLAAFADEPLIGRDREIAALREATIPRVGRRAALVLGEPGIGKTRHAAAAAAAAQADGAVVVLARCPLEPVVAFEPWVRAIGELALAGDAAWCRGLADAAGAELAALVPELSAATVVPSESGGADALVVAEGQRYRLLRGIGATLARAAGDAPLHVVLDDAHWCDPASAQALGHLLDSAPVEQLVLVATAREGEFGRGHPVSRVLAELRRTRDMSELRLVGLDVHGLAALVGKRVGRAITPRLAARLQARTAGNPFFVGELVRDLEERDALRDDDVVEATAAPDAVTDLVEERLERLDATTMRLLVAVAAIGPSAPIALAARAAGLDEGETARAVGEALAERLVEELAVPRPTVGFPHALIREGLVARTDAAAGARLHLAIAQALEHEPDVEPAERARHYGLAVPVAGPEIAIAAHLEAGRGAAEAHDSEQAAAHLRRALALIPESDLVARAAALLELGEQLLLSADRVAARDAFRAAADAARATGDDGTLARAALGFAGGDIGFGWEAGLDDVSPPLLREGLAAIGDSDPRMAQRMTFRLAYLQVFSDEDAELAALAERSAELGDLMGDDEAKLIARFTRLMSRYNHSPDGLPCAGLISELLNEALEMTELARRAGRDDLLLRTLGWLAFAEYSHGHIARCDRALAEAREIAERIGSPRFMWEVDIAAGQRLLDSGDRAGGEALIRRAGSVLRRLSPDLHVIVEMSLLALSESIYGGNPTPMRIGYEAVEKVFAKSYALAATTWLTALDGDHETARRRLTSLLADDGERLRRPDVQVPFTVALLALTATVVGDREAGNRLRPMLESLRPYLIVVAPMICFPFLGGWVIGRLELLAGNAELAVRELHEAVEQADAYGLIWPRSWPRVDLALALHRRGDPGDAERADATLREAEELAECFGIAEVSGHAAAARAELEGREPPARDRASQRLRPLRALTTRTGRRTLAAMVGSLDDAALERRFAEPGRQRALLRAMARGFQPAQADDFQGLVAYELEPHAIDPPPGAPWRWALALDAPAGQARLIEPAPLDAVTTIRIGLADWVRATAGLKNPIHAMVAGRCSIEGDVLLAMRFEAMFGAP